MEKDKIEGEVRNPLQWPDDRPRTRLQDRKVQAAWKHDYTKVLALVERELTLIRSTGYVITHNGVSSEDGGVAVWFTMKPHDDYGWQEALGFVGVIPTVQEIERKYMREIQRTKCHPDHPERPANYRELFHELTKHRDNAIAWARGTRQFVHDKVMAVDTFKEIRHNLNAIRLTISALRQIERCGSPMMMEQALRGYSKQITAKATEESHEHASVVA